MKTIGGLVGQELCAPVRLPADPETGEDHPARWRRTTQAVDRWNRGWDTGGDHDTC